MTTWQELLGVSHAQRAHSIIPVDGVKNRFNRMPFSPSVRKQDGFFTVREKRHVASSTAAVDPYVG
ncbi:hypothetical protein ACFLSW_03215 [Candidatus Bipolaricaulota bacterium]